MGIVVDLQARTVRGADNAFALTSQLPLQTSPEGYLLTVPALIVEVLSPMTGPALFFRRLPNTWPRVRASSGPWTTPTAPSPYMNPGPGRPSCAAGSRCASRASPHGGAAFRQSALRVKATSQPLAGFFAITYLQAGNNRDIFRPSDERFARQALSGAAVGNHGTFSCIGPALTRGLFCFQAGIRVQRLRSQLRRQEVNPLPGS